MKRFNKLAKDKPPDRNEGCRTERRLMAKADPDDTAKTQDALMKAT